jgi:hypothetical protein
LKIKERERRNIREADALAKVAANVVMLERYR